MNQPPQGSDNPFDRSPFGPPSGQGGSGDRGQGGSYPSYGQPGSNPYGSPGQGSYGSPGQGQGADQTRQFPPYQDGRPGSGAPYSGGQAPSYGQQGPYGQQPPFGQPGGQSPYGFMGPGGPGGPGDPNGPGGPGGSRGGGKGPLIIIGSIVAVLVLVAAGLGIYLANKDDEPSTTAGSSTSSSAAPSSAAAAAPSTSKGRTATPTAPSSSAQSSPRGGASSSAKSTDPTVSGSSFTVVYEAEGAGISKALMTYSGEKDGGIQQDSDVSLPWSKQFTETKQSFHVYVFSASNFASGSSPITCRIKIDGKVVSENTASGSYASAQCSTTVN